MGVLKAGEDVDAFDYTQKESALSRAKKGPL